MWRPARQREALVQFGLSLLLLLTPLEGAGAADPKLLPNCRAPSGSTLTCDLRATGFADFDAVKARIKGGADLETTFEAFNPGENGTATFYLIQAMPSARRSTLTQMTDAVAAFSDRRDGKRRFTAYTFGNQLSLVADSGSSKNEFIRQIIAVEPSSSTIQLYKMAHQAIEALAKETGARKSLVILGDGSTDDTGYDHDQVVKAAKDAGVVIHVLGFFDDARLRPRFQKLARLAEDTGGFAGEAKRSAAARDFDKTMVTGRFVNEVLENGGRAEVTLAGPTGNQTVEFTADLAGGGKLAADVQVAVPAAPSQSANPEPAARTAPEPEPADEAGSFDWLTDNPILLAALGIILGGGIVAFLVHSTRPQPEAVSEREPAPATEFEAQTVFVAPDLEAEGEPFKDADGRPAIYGWLEGVDDSGSRHPLRTTNVRVGRHRDNDICIQNDSISRRHAVLHYNADTRRFVITDLGGGNGVVVNKTKYRTRELNDGDVVELGEVRLRFRAENDFQT